MLCIENMNRIYWILTHVSSDNFEDIAERSASGREGEEEKENPSGNKDQSRRRQIQIHIGLCWRNDQADLQ